eukprot:CAMPEP_0178816250 /NCGR_PEP_ID=MMETSP0746-20121128/1250_1 /TAXON_ID=913974 /ORGANISM="Nitzschia punctata, Strain CCMP561" /LENGTH=137 /DNA_ID=CAMNT_0020477259 /DNA_START=220 /DNA_END=633 /DNA_ORIENTATION=+
MSATTRMEPLYHSAAMLPSSSSSSSLPPNIHSMRKPKIASPTTDVDRALDRIFQRAFPLPCSLLPEGDRTAAKNDSNHLDLPPPPRFEQEEPFFPVEKDIFVMNRNARRPKKANKGARPCSRVSRRQKKEKIGKRKR